MTDNESRQTDAGAATYVGSGDPARRRSDYYPAWLANLADDVTVEASAMNGRRSAEAVQAIVVAARSLYEGQEINFAGPYGDNGFLDCKPLPRRRVLNPSGLKLRP